MFIPLRGTWLLRMNFSKSRFNTFKDVTLLNSEIEKKFMRSSGPGGQSVNTTNSKAEVRININQCNIIDPFILANLHKNYSSYLNKSNELIVCSQLHKSQKANLEECIEKIQKILFNCSLVQ